MATPGHTDDSVCFLLPGDGPDRLGADRGHHPGPRHHRHRPARRQSGRLPRLACGCWPGSARASCCRRTGRSCPTCRRSPASTWRTVNSGWTRSVPRSAFSGRMRPSAPSPTWSTTTSTRRCGSLRSTRWLRSWTTCDGTGTGRRTAVNESGLDGVLPLLACPHCARALTGRLDGVVGCRTGHRFDVARQGYLSLLGSRSRTDTGDSADMVAARVAISSAPATTGRSPTPLPPGDRRAGAGDRCRHRVLPGGGAASGWRRIPRPTHVGLALDASRYAARRAASRSADRLGRRGRLVPAAGPRRRRSARC